MEPKHSWLLALGRGPIDPGGPFAIRGGPDSALHSKAESGDEAGSGCGRRPRRWRRWRRDMAAGRTTPAGQKKEEQHQGKNSRRARHIRARAVYAFKHSLYSRADLEFCWIC